jgi:hypothetical protein
MEYLCDLMAAVVKGNFSIKILMREALVASQTDSAMRANYAGEFLTAKAL